MAIEMKAAVNGLIAELASGESIAHTLVAYTADEVTTLLKRYCTVDAPSSSSPALLPRVGCAGACIVFCNTLLAKACAARYKACWYLKAVEM